MNPRPDEKLKSAYQAFDQDHAGLREDLLNRLPTVLVPSPTSWRIMPARWQRPWAMGLAASLFLSLACCALFYFRSPSAAYGVADIPGHLASCRSVRVDGWEQLYGVRYPIHRYVEAGKYLCTTSLAGENGKVFTGYWVSDPQKYAIISHSDHTATVGKEDALAFELSSQSLLQVGLADQLLGPDAQGYVKAGQSTVQGVRADVYEKRESSAVRRLVFLNPRTGMPLQLQLYRTDRSGHESLTQELTISTNVAPPTDLPSLDPPAGYAVIHHDREPREALNGIAASVNGETFEVLVHLDIDDKAMLLCWEHFRSLPPGRANTQTHATSQSLTTPEFTFPDGKRRYTLFPLHEESSDGHVVHWSLLVPENGGPIDEAQIDLRSANGSVHLGLKALRFNRDDLARLVIQTQRITMPPGSAPMPLEQLEKLIADRSRR